MLPKFPTFKNISVEDRGLVEAFTHKYEPYSDFNFTSLWSWDTNSERSISELNGNLVVRFTDYKTNAPSFSFLGTSAFEKTSEQLLAFAQASNITTVLTLMPEEAISELTQNSMLLIVEDRDNHDYVYSVSKLAKLEGIEYKQKRHLANKFLREYPQAEFQIKNLADKEVKEKIFSVIRRWENKKIADNKTYDIEHEEMAIWRLLETATSHQLVMSCVLLKNEMLAFSIDEILPNSYAISHFFKADSSYSGIFDFLSKNLSEYMQKNNVIFWNWEQDLGVENLRKSKMSYRPVRFLKKYRVSVKP